MSTSRRRRWAPLLLVIAFVVVPLVEIYAIIQVGQAIGPWWTILLLVVDSIVGAWLVKREGRRAWRALRDAMGNRLPTKELADGALVVVGGTLLLTPGFVTDVLGFLLLLPVTRPIFRRLLTSYAASRVTVVTARRTGYGAPFGQTENRPEPPAGEAVVRGEVLDEQ